MATPETVLQEIAPAGIEAPRHTVIVGAEGEYTRLVTDPGTPKAANAPESRLGFIEEELGRHIAEFRRIGLDASEISAVLPSSARVAEACIVQRAAILSTQNLGRAVVHSAAAG